LLAAGDRVVAVDPFSLGESRTGNRDSLLTLLVAAVGERALGIQAAQLHAVARWARQVHGQPVTLVSRGPRSSVSALVAAALDPEIAGAKLHDALGSLRELIEENRSVEAMPELFCFGLLASYDTRQLGALAAPRPVRWVSPSSRARLELALLRAWYALFGVDFDPTDRPTLPRAPVVDHGTGATRPPEPVPRVVA
jgi:hypothetical protein